MHRILLASLTLFVLLAHLSTAAGQEMIAHDLSISIDPDGHRLSAEDTITLPDGMLPELRFALHRGLNPKSLTPGVQLFREAEETKDLLYETYQVTLPQHANSFSLRYEGTIDHPLESYGAEYARGFRQTPGTISREGVYLSGGTFWYPRFETGELSFTLTVRLPEHWDAVSQGSRTIHNIEQGLRIVRWESLHPQEEIFMIAAQFTEYTRPADQIQAMVFLRTPDEKLAGKYLDATAQYVRMYDGLIGPYPYSKFALVENFWETGFGMPSFTLLGPKVIRFPFILHSSYPHEILHNWWGNCVFPDFQKGNWSEGLTAYLADHLIKEQQGQGTEYRQTTLQKYADYAAAGRDFPLTAFTSRHSSASEAVGYGKSLMFFHMLRQDLSDDVFIKGLQQFYQDNKFQLASFADMQMSFEKVADKKLGPFFEQWILRTGAPQLKVDNAHVRQEGDQFVLQLTLNQEQADKPYFLQVPLVVTLKDHHQAQRLIVEMDRKQKTIELRFPSRPLRIDVDPEFDLFRRLDRNEIPPALTQAFGAKKVLVLLPSASGTMLDSYRLFAQSWAQSGPDTVEVRLDSEIDQLPDDRAVAIFGWENRFLDKLSSALHGYDTQVTSDAVQIGNTRIPRKNHSVVLTARSPANQDFAFTWVATDVAAAIPGLGRKLPHYHKYSYLGFEGEEPENTAKGRWPVLNSPMTVLLQDADGSVSPTAMGDLPARKPLASLPPVFSKERMLETINTLASDTLKGRGFGSAELDLAADFIAAKFREAGLRPLGDENDSYFQQWTERDGNPARQTELKNIVGFIPGTNPEFNKQSVVVGAHYDHLGLGWPEGRQEDKGKIHPGADDNASGVAVLIELATVLSKNAAPERNVVFVAFSGEEAGKKGSKHYVSNQDQFPTAQTMAMINLDTVGRLDNKNLLVLGAGSAREWVHIFRGAGFVTGVNIEVVSEELDSSDQKSFQEAGIPAVQLFSGPHLDYHRPTDTLDKIDPDGLVKVAMVGKEAVEYLANRKEPLTSTLSESTEHAASPPQRGRKVSLGTVPDFAYEGDGYRLSGVVPGSPAEAVGFKEGDVVIRLNDSPIKNLKDLSDILKSLMPGDKVTVTYLRGGKELSVKTELLSR